MVDRVGRSTIIDGQHGAFNPSSVHVPHPMPHGVKNLEALSVRPGSGKNLRIRQLAIAPLFNQTPVTHPQKQFPPVIRLFLEYPTGQSVEKFVVVDERVSLRCHECRVNRVMPRHIQAAEQFLLLFLEWCGGFHQMQGDAPPLPPSEVFHDLRGESAAAGAAFYDMILAPSTVGGFS